MCVCFSELCVLHQLSKQRMHAWCWLVKGVSAKFVVTELTESCPANRLWVIQSKTDWRSLIYEAGREKGLQWNKLRFKLSRLFLFLSYQTIKAAAKNMKAERSDADGLHSVLCPSDWHFGSITEICKKSRQVTMNVSVDPPAPQRTDSDVLSDLLSCSSVIMTNSDSWNVSHTMIIWGPWNELQIFMVQWRINAWFVQRPADFSDYITIRSELSQKTSEWNVQIDMKVSEYMTDKNRQIINMLAVIKAEASRGQSSRWEFAVVSVSLELGSSNLVWKLLTVLQILTL